MGDYDFTPVIEWFRELRQRPDEQRTLRQIANPADTLFAPALYRLRSALPGTKPARLAFVVWVLARVDEHDAIQSVASAAADRVSKPCMKRLLESEQLTEASLRMAEVVRRLERRANVLDLAESIYWWGPRLARCWWLDYAHAEHASELTAVTA